MAETDAARIVVSAGASERTDLVLVLKRTAVDAYPGGCRTAGTPMRTSTRTCTAA